MAAAAIGLHDWQEIARVARLGRRTKADKRLGIVRLEIKLMAMRAVLEVGLDQVSAV